MREVRLTERTVLVHPDDVDLDAAKALAAKYDTSVVANPCVPRGKAFVVDAGTTIGWPAP